MKGWENFFIEGLTGYFPPVDMTTDSDDDNSDSESDFSSDYENGNLVDGEVVYTPPNTYHDSFAIPRMAGGRRKRFR